MINQIMKSVIQHLGGFGHPLITTRNLLNLTCISIIWKDTCEEQLESNYSTFSVEAPVKENKTLPILPSPTFVIVLLVPCLSVHLSHHQLVSRPPSISLLVHLNRLSQRRGRRKNKRKAEMIDLLLHQPQPCHRRQTLASLAIAWFVSINSMPSWERTKK